MPYPLLLHGKHAPGPVPYEPFGGWLVPWRFGEAREEHRALTEGAGLLDYSLLAQIEVRGEDRIAFLHNLLTNDIKRLTPGAGCRAALLTPEARVIAPMLVLADAEACWLLCDAGLAAALAKALEGYVFGERVQIVSHERRAAALAVQGLESLEVLGKLGWPVPAEEEAHATVAWDGVPLRIIRHALLGGRGALLLAEADAAERLWHGVQRLAGPRLRLAGWQAFDVARIEAGIPWFGLDVDADHLLPETGMQGPLVSETKGCYVGQEIIARVATYGSPSRRLRQLVVDGDRVPSPGEPVRHLGEDAGRITSGCRSFATGAPIALAMLKRTAYDVGTVVEIGGQPATVMELPAAVSPGGSARTPGGG